MNKLFIRYIELKDSVRYNEAHIEYKQYTEKIKKKYTWKIEKKSISLKDSIFEDASNIIENHTKLVNPYDIANTLNYLFTNIVLGIQSLVK